MNVRDVLGRHGTISKIFFVIFGIALLSISSLLFAANEQSKPRQHIVFLSDKNSVTIGESVVLSWDITEILKKGGICTASGSSNWDGPLIKEKGKRIVVPRTSTEYTIRCEGLEPMRQPVKVLPWIPSPERKDPLGIDFFIAGHPDGAVYKNEEVTLNWEVIPQARASKEKCTFEGRPADPIGHALVKPQKQNETYALLCLQTAVRLSLDLLPPKIETFKAFSIDPLSGTEDEVTKDEDVPLGMKLKLTWDANGADECVGMVRAKGQSPIVKDSLSDDEEKWLTGKKKPSGEAMVTPRGDRTYTLLCRTDIAGGKALETNATISLKVTEDAPQLQFSVRKSEWQTVPPSVSLEWKGKNIRSCEASSDNDVWSGRRGVEGNDIVSAEASRSYTLTCMSVSGKKVEKRLLVPKELKEPTLAFEFTFGAGPARTTLTLEKASGVDIRWKATNSRFCTASSQPSIWSGKKGHEGEESIQVNADTTLTLQCGDQKKILTIDIGEKGNEKEPLTTGLKFWIKSPRIDAKAVGIDDSKQGDTPIVATVAAGQPVVLTWTTDDTFDKERKCRAFVEKGTKDDRWNGSVPLTSGDVGVGVRPTTSTLYRIACTKITDGREVIASVFVNVNEASKKLPLVDFRFEEVGAESTVRLTWKTDNAKTCTASSSDPQWAGPIAVSEKESSRLIKRPGKTLVSGYFLECENAQASAMALVHVDWSAVGSVKPIVQPKPVRKEPQLSIKSAPLSGGAVGVQGVQTEIFRFLITAQGGDVAVESFDFQINGSNKPSEHVKTYDLFDLTTNLWLGIATIQADHVVFTSPFKSEFILSDGETRTLRLLADTQDITKNASGPVALQASLNKEQGVKWSYYPVKGEKKQIIAGPTDAVLGQTILFGAQPKPQPQKGTLSATREFDVVTTTPLVGGKPLSPLTFRLKADREPIIFSSFELTADTPGLLASLGGGIQLKNKLTNAYLPARATGSGSTALSVYGFGDVQIPAGESVLLELTVTVPPVLTSSVEAALKKAQSDTIRLQSVAAIGFISNEKLSITAPLALLTIVPPEQIIEKPISTPQKLSVSSFSYSDIVMTPGKPQLLSGMNVHNFTDKPVAVGSVLLKFSSPAIDRVQLQYSNKGGEYDEKTETIAGSGRENHFFFTFPKPLVIDPDPKIPYKRGDAGLMKWWIAGVPKNVDKTVVFETILEEAISPQGETIRLESYKEPVLNFAVSNFAARLREDPISYTILTVAPDQPLLLSWDSESMDEQKGCSASIGLGGNDKDKREWSGKKALNGEAWVYPSVSTLYKLNCVAGDRTVTRDVFVQINDLSRSIPFIDFTYRKGKNEKKQEGVYLTWQVKNASSCEASNGSHEKQTSWGGKKIFGKDKFTEFVARPAGETLNSFFLQCKPANKDLKGYFSSSFNVFWEKEKEQKDQIVLSLDPKVPSELPVGSIPGRQLLGAFTVDLPEGTESLDRIVVVRDEKFGEQTLGQFFKTLEFQYEDSASNQRWIQSFTVSGDNALVFGKLPVSLIRGTKGPLSVMVYGQLASEDGLRKLKLSEKGERMRLVIVEVDARTKASPAHLFAPFELQTFVVKTPTPLPPPPPVVQQGILFASRSGTNSIEIQDKQVNITLAKVSLEALGEDIEIRSITINHSIGTEFSSLLSRPQLVIKQDNTLFAIGTPQGNSLYFSPFIFAKKLILPKTGNPIELLLIADVSPSIPESLKEKIRSNPVVLSLKVNGVSGIGLVSNQAIGNTMPFDLVTLSVPPKTVDKTACDATVETFKETGKIRCGRIQWDITPQSAQTFNGDPRPYLMKYDELYGFYKDFMGGYEPAQRKVTLRENPKNEYPADANWVDSVIRMNTPFTREHIAYLGNTPDKTFSPSFMHEMGHIFGLGPQTRSAYIWKDMTEAHANMVGILPYMMAYDGQFKLISDFWCKNKLKKSWPCPDYFTNFEDYPEWLGANKDLQAYIDRGETFRTLFVDPPKDQNLYERGGKFQTMITTLYSEFKKQGKAKQFYEGYKKTQQFYVKNPSIFPSAWIYGDPYFDFAPDLILRANTYLFLLSSYIKADILTPFETRWRTPIRPEVKEAFAKVAKDNFSEDSIIAALKMILPQPLPTRFIQTLSGLKGEYYKNKDLIGSPALTRIDPHIDFVWGDTPPATSISNNLFSVRWTGFIVAPETNTYTFSTIGDDGVRLWVDNKQLVDDWNVHAPTLKTGTIKLEKGRAYPIKLEYFEEWYGSGVRLAWKTGSGYEEIIPSNVLFPQNPSSAEIKKSADVPSAIQRSSSADALLRTLNLGSGIR